MRIKILFLFVLALALSPTAFSQDYAFKVLINKGGSEFKVGDSWQPVKSGATLKSGDELKLTDNSYIGLVHVSGEPMELKKAGSYKVSALAATIGHGSSVLHKYTDFILSSNSAEAKKNRLSATGAVHRGEATAIQIMLPENQHAGIFNTGAIISWESGKVEGPYVVLINNMFGEELAKIETAKSMLRVDLTDPKFASENAVLVEVYSKADPSKKSAEKLIKKLSAADQEKIMVSLATIKDEVTEQTAFNKLILAGFYEQNQLFIDAVTSYEEAIGLAPEVPFYKEAYEDFLIRQGIKR